MRTSVLATVSLLLLTACANSIRHPLDDSEPRPSSLAAAVDEADTEMDAVGDAALAGAIFSSMEWPAPDGCGVNPEHPEQGEVSLVLERSYADLPSGTTQTAVLEAASTHWSAGGHTVGEGSPSMAEQRIARIHGVSYAAVSVDGGIAVRAFLPCY